MSIQPASDLLAGSAGEIASAIRRRTVSALEVLELHLERIAEVNPRLNAIVTLCEERARSAAASADRALGTGQEPGPLHGVPFTVKDSIAIEGVRSTAGTLLLRDFVPERTAPAVERLERAGAILIGKTNCPEFGLDVHTTNRLFGPTLNPLEEAVTPGGSSGGDAAAVASGCAAFGIGTDYGGSIRWPAHCTGLMGLRPTPGLVPGTGVLPYASTDPLPPPSSVALLSRAHTIGPLARSVADLWTILETIAGPDGLDAQTVPVPLGDPDQVAIEQLACAWLEGEGTCSVRPDLVAVVAHAADLLTGLGLRVARLAPPGLERAEEIYAAYRAADGLPVHVALARGREDELTDGMRSWFATVTRATVEEYQRLAGERDALRARVLEFMEEWPILLLPVATGPAFRVDSLDFAERFRVVAPCRAISLLGLPAAAVTCGRSEEGLPVAVQIVGRPFADHEVIAVASALEHGRGNG